LSLGIVVIGRNEGDRLERCLRSVLRGADAVVYADSGSTDGSVARALALGADVVELDASAPFTAARGRNAGFDRLMSAHPGIDLVQVVDGDCEVQPGWLAAATAFLEAHPDVAVVCGRRRERFPEASPWNQLADVEWDTPVGESQACGGDAMIRADAWRRAGGYDPTLIAGEDPEFCWRIRRDGGRIVRLDAEMTLHDAALHRVGQWWRRQSRSGHAYAETVWRHRHAPDPLRWRRLASLVFWGGAWPAACLLLAWPTGGWSLLGLLAYALPAYRSFRDARTRWPARVAALWAGACVVGKAAELQGAAVFASNHLVRRRATTLIEYKGPGT
jgi:glycosyltransferase involved in cell wall biosynthesis